MTQSTSLPAIRVPPHLQASSSPSPHSPQTESHLRAASSPKTPPRTPERTAAHGFVSNESMLQAENDDLRSKMHKVINAARGTQGVLRRLWSQHEAAQMQIQQLKAELLQARSQREGAWSTSGGEEGRLPVEEDEAGASRVEPAGVDAGRRFPPCSHRSAA